MITHLGYRSFLPADTLPSMTKLYSIPDHEIAIECRVCGHAGLVPVALVLAKDGRTAAQLVAAERCSRRCTKIVCNRRIIYTTDYTRGLLRVLVVRIHPNERFVAIHDSAAEASRQQVRKEAAYPSGQIDALTVPEVPFLSSVDVWRWH